MIFTIKCYPKGLYGENTYLITDNDSGQKAVIDPGYIDDQIIKEIGDADNLKYLLLTHAHHDHFLAVSDYKSIFPKAMFAAPGKDMPLLKGSECPQPDDLLKENDIITLGKTVFKVIETPGHTAGGICFFTDECIFTGDTLFKLSVGRTDLESGDWFTLLHSIQDKLYILDERLIVYPGHGEPTTIGYEKRANPFV